MSVSNMYHIIAAYKSTHSHIIYFRELFLSFPTSHPKSNNFNANNK